MTSLPTFCKIAHCLYFSWGKMKPFGENYSFWNKFYFSCFLCKILIGFYIILKNKQILQTNANKCSWGLFYIACTTENLNFKKILLWLKLCKFFLLSQNYFLKTNNYTCVSLLCLQLIQAEQILISKNIRNSENHLPLWWKKDSVVSNTLQKQLGYDRVTESFMLPV